MFTPRQQTYWEKLQRQPAMQMAIERLGLEPVETSEYRRNVEITKRVDVLLDQIEQAPKSKRYVIKARLPWDPVDLSWVKPGEVPF